MERRTHQFGGEWTEQKLEVLRQYLEKYTTALQWKPFPSNPFKKIYIDAFAGTGYREDRLARTKRSEIPFLELGQQDNQDLLDGSARIALQTRPQFQKYVFIEKSPKKCEQLEKLRQEFSELSSDIEIRQGDANEEILKLCSAINWKSHRAVLFLDPFGMQVNWSTIEAIALTKAIDLWVLFPHAIALNRLVTQSGRINAKWKQRIDSFLGTTDWYEDFYNTVQEKDMFGEEHVFLEKVHVDVIGKYYNNRLNKIFAGVAAKPGVLRRAPNKPLYLLCFAVANDRGKRIALSIAEHLLKGLQ